MMSIDPTLMLLLIEALVVVGAVLVIALIVVVRRVNGERVALRKLVADVKSMSIDGQDSLVAAVKSIGLGTKTDKELAQVSQRHRKVYQAFIDAFTKRDQASVNAFKQHTENLVNGYNNLLQQAQQSIEQLEIAKTSAENMIENDPRDAVIEKLQQDYVAIKKQLVEAETSMEEMLDEYTRMFAEKNVNPNQLTTMQAAAAEKAAKDKKATHSTENPTSSEKKTKLAIDDLPNIDTELDLHEE